jgi:hypothetical protein
MGGGVRHAASSAGRTEASPLAGEGDQAVVATVVAVKTQETVGQDPAAQVGPQLLLDEARRRLAACRGAGEEALEVLPDDAVQKRLLGRSTRVGVVARLGRHREGVGVQTARRACSSGCAGPRAGARHARVHLSTARR